MWLFLCPLANALRVGCGMIPVTVRYHALLATVTLLRVACVLFG